VPSGQVGGDNDDTEPAPRKKRSRQRKESAATDAAEDEPPATTAAVVTAEAAPPTARQIAEANQLRKALRIHVYGNDIPAPVQSAHELLERLGLRSFLHRNIMTAGARRPAVATPSDTGAAIATRGPLSRAPACTLGGPHDPRTTLRPLCAPLSQATTS